MRVISWLVVVAALTIGIRPASALPITYVESGLLTGTLGTSAFTNALLTFTFSGDTDHIVNMSPYFLNMAGASTVSIQGLGTAIFTGIHLGPLAQILGSQIPGAGFYDADTLFAIVTIGDPFNNYMLNTALGPVTGQFRTNGNFPTPTDRGAFVINSVASQGTFQAITTSTTPEPGGFLLMSTGVLAIFTTARRKFAHRTR